MTTCYTIFTVADKKYEQIRCDFIKKESEKFVHEV